MNLHDLKRKFLEISNAQKISALALTFLLTTTLTLGIYRLNHSNTDDRSGAASSPFKLYSIQNANDIANEDGSKALESPDPGCKSNTSSCANWIGNGEHADASYLGLRFTNLNIPANIKVTGAKILLTSTKDQWIDMSVKAFGESKVFPEPFSDMNRPSQRMLTSAFDSTPETQTNVATKKDDLITIDVTKSIRELFDSGNRTMVSFIIRGSSGPYARKYFYNFYVPAKSPKLQITYITNTDGTTPTPTALQPTQTPLPTPTSAVSPTAKPSATTSPTGSSGGVNLSMAMGLWSPNTKYDTCSKAVHDSYFVTGPDGKRYPTWHPPVDAKTGCSFGHEHGRDPKGSNLMTLINQTYGGIPFGFANEALDAYNPSLMRHEDHVGHKIEWENNVRMDKSVTNGGSDRAPTDIYCDFLMKVHQGTHSKDAFVNNLHEIEYFAQCTDGTKIASIKMASFGKAGEFDGGTVAGGQQIIKVPNATPVPPNTYSKGDRLIPTINKVNEYILVPDGKFSLFSNGLYEDWISANYLTTSDGRQLAYFDPHFAVFKPSRFYDPSQPDNLRRSIDVCYMKESNGDRARGGECDEVTDYRDGSTIAASERIPFDDPRSPFNGVTREFYFNQTDLQNSGGPTTWYTDPFGGNAKSAPFTGSIKQYLASVTSNRGFAFESQAIGKTRDYSCLAPDKPTASTCSKIHAPN